MAIGNLPNFARRRNFQNLQNWQRNSIKDSHSSSLTRFPSQQIQMPATDQNSITQVNKIIRNRRSIKPKQFTGEQIEDAIVWKMLENANWAPTHGKTEPWRFFVFTGEAKQQLGELLAELYLQVTAAEAIKPAKADKLKQNAEASSHLIVIAMERQKSKKIPEVEEIEAVACAVQNLHLTATAYGVGGYWSSGKAICNDQLRDHLGMNADDRVLGLFYVGEPDGQWPTSERSAIESKVVWKS